MKRKKDEVMKKDEGVSIPRIAYDHHWVWCGPTLLPHKLVITINNKK